MQSIDSLSGRLTKTPASGRPCRTMANMETVIARAALCAQQEDKSAPLPSGSIPLLHLTFLFFSPKSLFPLGRQLGRITRVRSGCRYVTIIRTIVPSSRLWHLETTPQQNEPHRRKFGWRRLTARIWHCRRKSRILLN